MVDFNWILSILILVLLAWKVQTINVGGHDFLTTTMAYRKKANTAVTRACMPPDDAVCTEEKTYCAAFHVGKNFYATAAHCLVGVDGFIQDPEELEIVGVGKVHVDIVLHHNFDNMTGVDVAWIHYRHPENVPTVRVANKLPIDCKMFSMDVFDTAVEGIHAGHRWDEVPMKRIYQAEDPVTGRMHKSQAHYAMFHPAKDATVEHIVMCTAEDSNHLYEVHYIEVGFIANVLTTVDCHYAKCGYVAPENMIILPTTTSTSISSTSTTSTTPITSTTTTTTLTTTTPISTTTIATTSTAAITTSNSTTTTPTTALSTTTTNLTRIWTTTTTTNQPETRASQKAELRILPPLSTSTVIPSEAPSVLPNISTSTANHATSRATVKYNWGTLPPQSYADWAAGHPSQFAGQSSALSLVPTVLSQQNKRLTASGEANWSAGNSKWTAGSPSWSAGNSKWTAGSPSGSAGNSKWTAGSPSWSAGNSKWAAGSPSWSDGSPASIAVSPSGSTENSKLTAGSPSGSAGNSKWTAGSPSWSAGNSKWTAGSPSGSAGNSKWTAGSPSWSAGNSKWAAGSPSWSAGNSKWIAGSPSRSAGNTKWTSGSPSWSDGSPASIAVSPSGSTENSKLTAGNPSWSAGNSKSSDGSQSWSAGSPTSNAGGPSWSAGNSKWTADSPAWAAGNTKWSSGSPSWSTGSPTSIAVGPSGSAGNSIWSSSSSTSAAEGSLWQAGNSKWTGGSPSWSAGSSTSIVVEPSGSVGSSKLTAGSPSWATANLKSSEESPLWSAGSPQSIAGVLSWSAGESQLTAGSPSWSAGKPTSIAVGPSGSAGSSKLTAGNQPWSAGNSKLGNNNAESSTMISRDTSSSAEGPNWTAGSAGWLAAGSLRSSDDTENSADSSLTNIIGAKLDITRSSEWTAGGSSFNSENSNWIGGPPSKLTDTNSSEHFYNTVGNEGYSKLGSQQSDGSAPLLNYSEQDSSWPHGHFHDTGDQSQWLTTLMLDRYPSTQTQAYFSYPAKSVEIDGASLQTENGLWTPRDVTYYMQPGKILFEDESNQNFTEKIDAANVFMFKSEIDSTNQMDEVFNEPDEEYAVPEEMKTLDKIYYDYLSPDPSSESAMDSVHMRSEDSLLQEGRLPLEIPTTRRKCRRPSTAVRKCKPSGTALKSTPREKEINPIPIKNIAKQNADSRAVAIGQCSAVLQTVLSICLVSLITY